MTMQDATRQSLTSNWEQAKQEIRTQFPELTDEDVANGDPEALAQKIGERTGQDPAMISRRLDDVAAAIQSEGQSQTQSQDQTQS